MRSVLIFVSFLLLTSLVHATEFGIGSELETDELADQAATLGVTWVRLTFDWFQIEPQRGSFNWDTADQQVERAQNRRLKICAILNGTPKWANGGHSTQTPPRDAQDWIDFVTAVVSRYRSSQTIGAYEIWNEPNLDRFWKGKQREYIDKILIPGARAVRSADPNALVIAPAFSNQWIFQSDWPLREVVRVAGDQIDIVSVHYYPDAHVPFGEYLDRWIGTSRLEKPVWITEIGELGCSGKKGWLNQQSQNYENFLQAISERSDWITNVFPYRLWDPRDQCDKNGNGYGLTAGDPPVERPAFQTYKDFIAKHRAAEP